MTDLGTKLTSCAALVNTMPSVQSYKNIFQEVFKLLFSDSRSWSNHASWVHTCISPPFKRGGNWQPASIKFHKGKEITEEQRVSANAFSPSHPTQKFRIPLSL